MCRRLITPVKPCLEHWWPCRFRAAETVVQKVAAHLGRELGRELVFYDAWYVAELARPDLDLYLQQIYGRNSQPVVPLF